MKGRLRVASLRRTGSRQPASAATELSDPAATTHIQRVKQIPPRRPTSRRARSGRGRRQGRAALAQRGDTPRRARGPRSDPRPWVDTWHQHRPVKGWQGRRDLDRKGEPWSRPPARRRMAGLETARSASESGPVCAVGYRFSRRNSRPAATAAQDPQGIRCLGCWAVGRRQQACGSPEAGTRRRPSESPCCLPTQSRSASPPLWSRLAARAGDPYRGQALV
jgi:hypothetical protein